jgi:hypothetical protein
MAQYNSGKAEEAVLREQLHRAEYEKAVLEEMRLTRKKQVDYSRDLLVERMQTMKSWNETAESTENSILEKEKRAVLLSKDIDRQRKSALSNLDIDRLD